MSPADDLVLNTDLQPAAVAKLNASLASAKAPPPEVQYDLSDFATAATLGELLEEEYDYGEPLWNGSLLMLAKDALVEPPTTVTVTDIDELTPVESEYIQYFHHGDVIVDDDLGAFDSVWITGDLRVKGVIEASYLDAFADLIVGGNVTCAAIQFMGLSFIAGTLKVERLAYVQSQGETWVLGGIEGPLLVGEWGSIEGFETSGVQRALDIEEEEMAELAEALGVASDAADEHPFELVFRAIDAARVAQPG